MTQRWLAVLLSAALAGPTQAPPPTPPDRELETGVQQAQEGDFEAAILTLDGAVRRLTAAGNRPRDLSRAYLFLAIAYLGLAQEQSAKAKFLEALKANRELELSAKELPPQYLKFFEQVRKDALAAGTLTPSPAPSPRARSTPSPAPVTARSAPPAKKGGGASKGLLIGGGLLAVVGVGVAAAGGGGGSNPPPATTPTTAPGPTLEPTTTTTTQPGSTTTTTEPGSTTTTRPPSTTTTSTTTATTTPTTTTPPSTTTTTMAPSCPNPTPPDAPSVVTAGPGVSVSVRCSAPGAACTLTELGLRLAGGPRIGFNNSGVRSDVFGWNPCNPGGNGTHTLQCYANFQGGTSTAANAQVTVQGCSSAARFR